MSKKDIHFHLEVQVSNKEVLDRLTSIEELMTKQSDAIAGLTAGITEAVRRVDEDVAHLRDLLDQALATEVADQATIAQLQADADAAVASIDAATTALSSIDPDAAFPVVPPIEDPPPAEEPPAEEVPAEPAP